MMKMVKTVLLAASIATLGSSAFAGRIDGAAAEEVIVKGEILASQELNVGFLFVIEYRSKLYICRANISSITNEPEFHCRFID